MTLGFIGTGTISAAFIEGLAQAGRVDQILVSPRSESTSTKLAARYDHVRRCQSNAEVAAADIVFLGMKPAQVEEALDGIHFQPGQLVVSFVANLSLGELQSLVPRARVGRVLPLPPIARGKGPVLAYPHLPEFDGLLEGLGHKLFPQTEAEFLALMPVSAIMSSYFELQGALTGFAIAGGVSEETASIYVRTLFEGLAETALRTPASNLDGLPVEHETRGGLNERVRRELTGAGWFDAPAKILAGLTALRRDTLK